MAESGTDPIILALAKAPRLLESMGYFTIHKVDLNKERKALLETVDLLNSTIGDRPHFISGESSEVQLVARFTQPVVQSLDAVSEATDLLPYMTCLEKTVTVTGDVGAITKFPQLFFKSLFAFHAVCECENVVATPLLRRVLKAKSVQEIMVDPGFVEFVVTNLFLQHQGKTISWFCRYLMMDVKEVDAEVEVSAIPTLFMRVMEQNEMHGHCPGLCGRYFCYLLSLLKQNDYQAFQYFARRNGLSACLEFLNKESPTDVEACFICLGAMRKGKVQLDVLVFLYAQMLNPISEIVAVDALKILSGLISMESIPLSEFSKVPIDDLFGLGEGTDAMILGAIGLLQSLLKRHYTRVLDCIPPLFARICRGERLSTGTIERFFSTIQEAIAKNWIAKHDFLKDNKPMVLILLVSPQLGMILANCRSYSTTIQDVYNDADNDEDRFYIIKQVIMTESRSGRSSSLENTQATIISLIRRSGVMKRLLDLIDDSRIEQFANIFLLVTDVSVIKLFLECDGLKWLDGYLNRDVITIQCFLQVLTNILNADMIGPVSKWVGTLDFLHPLFDLPLEDLCRLAFDSTSAMPKLLKVPALLPLLTKVRVRLSPINAYNGSKYGLSEFIRRGESVSSVEYLEQFTNQYLRPEHYRVLEKHGKSFARYINPKGDHFVQWEMAPNSRESALLISFPKCKRVCFWMKVEDSPEDFENVIVNSSVFRLLANRGKFSLTRGTDVASISAKNDEWVFVALECDNDDDSHLLRLWINSTSKEIPFDRDTLGEFSLGLLNHNCEMRWFIGTSIRLFSSCKDSIETILENCRQDSSQPIGTKGEAILSPFGSTGFKQIGRTAYPVPYAGFSYYVRKRENLTAWFVRLRECKSREQFSDIFLMLLNCYLVADGKLADFVNQLCDAMKVKQSFVDETLINKVFAVLRKGDIDVLLRDIDLWDLYSIPFSKEVLNASISLPTTTCAYHFLTNEANRDVFLQLLVKCTQPVDTTQQIILILFAGNEELNGPLISSLLVHFDTFQKALNQVLPLSLFVELLCCQPVNLWSQFLDLLVIMSESDPEYLNDVANYSPRLVPIFASQLKTKRVWFQAMSLLTGVGVSEGFSLLIFESKLARPGFLPVAVGLVICGLVYTAVSHDDTFLPIIFEAITVLNGFFSAPIASVKSLFHVAVWHWSLIYHSNALKDVQCPKMPPVTDELLKNLENRLRDAWQLPVVASINKVECVEEGTCNRVISFMEALCGTVEQNTSDGYPIAHLKEEQLNRLSTFVANLVLTLRDDVRMFQKGLVILCLQGMSNYIQTLSKFSVGVITMILKDQRLLSAKKECLLVFLNAVAEVLETHSLDGVAVFYSAFLPSLRHLFDEQRLAPELAMPIRKLIMKAFDCLEPDVTRDFVNELIEHCNDICEGVGLFSTEFLRVFKRRISSQQNAMLSEVNVTEVPDSEESEWKIGPVDYAQELLLPVKYYTKEWTRLRRCARQMYSILQLILNAQLDIFMRVIERDMARILGLLWTCNMHQRKGEAIILSQTSRPWHPSRVLTQSPFSASSRPLEATKRTKQVDKPPCVVKRQIECNQIYDESYTDMSYKDFDATQYSWAVALDDGFRLREFLLVYRRLGNPIATENCFFRQGNQNMKCVLFTMANHIAILFNANVKEDTLQLDRNIHAIRLYQTFLESLKLGFYGQFGLFCGHVVLVIQLSELVYTTKHPMPGNKTAICVHTTNTPEFILIPESETFSGETTSKLLNRVQPDEPQPLTPRLHELTATDAVSMWVKHSISTWELLLTLNGLGGRSFADLDQYPVFPWLYGYKSGKQVIRDLKKPMGQQSKDRAQKYQKLHHSSKTHYYPTHYSTAQYVRDFLVRIPPFTQSELDRHGTFRNEGRVFRSFQESWALASKQDVNDVRELIPEFFCLPDLFADICKLDLRESKVPAVASVNGTLAPHAFTLRMLADLEASSDIRHWIDLIFGFQQRGPAADAAKNLFPPASYNLSAQELVDFDPLLEGADGVGYCTPQLFKGAVPSREPAQPVTFSNLTVKRADKTVKPLWRVVLTADSPVSVRLIQSKATLALITNTTQFNTRDSEFWWATRVSTSQLGYFVAIDLETDSTLVVQIVFRKGKAKDVKFLSRFWHQFTPNTRINGSDFLCASFHAAEILLWDFRRSVPIRTFTVPASIIDLGFDEYLGLIIVLSGPNLIVYTINGHPITSHRFEGQPSSLYVPFAPSAETLRPLFVGFADGTLTMVRLNYGDSALDEGWSQQISKHAITAITCETQTSFVCLDAQGDTFIISQADAPSCS